MISFHAWPGARARLARPYNDTASVWRRLLPAWLLLAAFAAAADDSGELRAAAAAERARAVAPGFDRAAFLARPDRLGAWLSPDGRQVAYLEGAGPNRGVWLLPTAGGAAKRLLPQTDATTLVWSRDGRWLFLQSPRQLFALAAAGQAGSTAIAKLGGRWERSFFGADPALPAAALVLETPPRVSRTARRWRLYRVDLHGRQTLLHEDARPVVDFEFDPQGRLAYLTRAEGDRQVIYRVGKDGLHAVMRCVNVERCSLLATAADGRSLWLNTDAQGGFNRLAQLLPDGRLLTRHADPRNEADIAQVVLDPITRQPLIANYRSTVASSHALQADVKRHVDAIQARFPQRDVSIQVGRGRGGRWLVQERAGSLKGERLHLYDPATGAFREILADDGFHFGRTPIKRLPETAMARKIAFSWRASDGMRLHGFITLPLGRDARRAPLIANIHGGPFNLFRPEFSAQSQLLANRGYAVFEPNFRGSTGLGRAYMLSARGDFGNGRVQQDIVEGVRYLLAQGIGDGQRVGIIGASFGGYSAMQGVTFQPELFKVAVAAVPPADFGWVLRSYARGVDQLSAGIPLSTTMRLLSLDPADPAIAERLRVQSPIANADRLSRPVLLLAGGDDERVPIRSVTHYAALLKSLGKPVSLFVDAEGQHQLVDPVTREAYLYLLEATLHRHLGGTAPAAPDAALRASLRKNLRLDADQLRPR